MLQVGEPYKFATQNSNGYQVEYIEKENYFINNKPAYKIKLTKIYYSTEPFWVYLGQRINGKWLTKQFNVQTMPLPLTEIECIDNVYKRDMMPIKIGEPDVWQLGKTIGVIKKGKTVTVVDTLTVDGGNYWVKVKEN